MVEQDSLPDQGTLERELMACSCDKVCVYMHTWCEGVCGRSLKVRETHFIILDCVMIPGTICWVVVSSVLLHGPLLGSFGGRY